MTNPTARTVQVVREALPGETCKNSHVFSVQTASVIGVIEELPCDQPAELIFAITEDAVTDYVELCAQCGEPLKVEMEQQVGGDAILP